MDFSSIQHSPLLDLRNTLDSAGLRAGLELLNQRVPHRYTVVYRFDGETFYGLVVIDKLKEPAPTLFNKVPFRDSFCQYTVGEGEFRTAASMSDARLAGHIHQANVQSYTGLPLTDSKGELYGTFCHLDLIPQPLSDSEFAFLQSAVVLLGGYLPDTAA